MGRSDESRESGTVDAPATPDAAALFESLRAGLAQEVGDEIAAILRDTLFSEGKRRRETALDVIRGQVGLPE
jgi:hypothetical protein